jgi:hypothetical protein
MSNKYKDFDDFFNEVEEKPAVTIKLFNKEYNLPREIPAKIMLDTFKAYKDGLSVLPEEKQMEMAISMLGEENVEEWCEKGLSMDQLAEIMKWVASQSTPDTNNSGKK